MIERILLVVAVVMLIADLISTIVYPSKHPIGVSVTSQHSTVEKKQDRLPIN